MGRTRHYHLAVTIPGQTTRYTTQTFWNETAYDENGNVWATQNSNDSVLQGVSNTTQKSCLILTYAAVPGTTTGEVAATYDFVVGLTPVEPTYPSTGNLLVQGALVAGPSGGNPRWKVTVPVYNGYTYEIYSNPTLADASWAAKPFALTQTGSADRNRYNATADGTLVIYVEEKAVKDFYKVTFPRARREHRHALMPTVFPRETDPTYENDFFPPDPDARRRVAPRGLPFIRPGVGDHADGCTFVQRLQRRRVPAHAARPRCR